MLSVLDDDIYDDEDEDFPGKSVADIKRLRKHIREQFLNSPNPYVKKKRIVREPRSKVDKTVYKANGEQAREVPPMEGRVGRGPRVGRGMVENQVDAADENGFEVLSFRNSYNHMQVQD